MIQQEHENLSGLINKPTNARLKKTETLTAAERLHFHYSKGMIVSRFEKQEGSTK